jgi:glycosyltransferase involved in cell wall biosynthesis
MAHWINYPAIVTKIPFLLECNDHPLSAVSYTKRGLHEPVEILERIDQAAAVYALPQCRSIAIPCEGYRYLFEHYFGSIFNSKFIQLHIPGCITEDIHPIRSETASFLCLASDYELKGVDLLIEAWLSIENKGSARLVIACPNVPEDVVRKTESQIKFILKGPLSNVEKKSLLSGSNVSIGSMHVHGGGNIFEGMEYGHAVIYFQTHSTFFREIGQEIPVPYYFYLPSHYGIHWKTFADFRAILRQDKRNRVFGNTIEQLAVAIKRYIEHPDLLYKDRRGALSAARGYASLDARNAKLRQIYGQILG